MKTGFSLPRMRSYMKFVKSISLFIIYPICMFSAGFYANIKFQEFFYPGKNQAENVNEIQVDEKNVGWESINDASDEVSDLTREVVSNQKQILTADTKYEVISSDITNGVQKVEITNVPEQYIGMTRTQFLTAMEQFQNNPGLKEQEEGFTMVEVEAFSNERVTLLKTYQPEEHFYIAVRNHYLVVLREDGRTTYQDTDIRLDELPDDVAKEVIEMKYMKDKNTLYNFLESYSS